MAAASLTLGACGHTSRTAAPAPVASIYFRPTLCSIPPAGTSATRVESDPILACSDPRSSTIASTSPHAQTPTGQVIVSNFDGSARWVLGPADMSAADLSSASVVAADQSGARYQVLVQFTSQGATAFNAVAAQRYQYYEADTSDPSVESQEAIEVDDVVVSVPVIQASSFNGTAVIEPPAPGLNASQAAKVAAAINAAIHA